MIDITAFECEITDPADVFIGYCRKPLSFGESDKPYLFVVLPSFSFKVALTPGNLSVLSLGLGKLLPDEADQQ